MEKFEPKQEGFFWGAYGQYRPTVWRVYALTNGTLKATGIGTNNIRKISEVKWICEVEKPNVGESAMDVLRHVRSCISKHQTEAKSTTLLIGVDWDRVDKVLRNSGGM